MRRLACGVCDLDGQHAKEPAMLRFASLLAEKFATPSTDAEFDFLRSITTLACRRFADLDCSCQAGVLKVRIPIREVGN